MKWNKISESIPKFDNRGHDRQPIFSEKILTYSTLGKCITIGRYCEHVTIKTNQSQKGYVVDGYILEYIPDATNQTAWYIPEYWISLPELPVNIKYEKIVCHESQHVKQEKSIIECGYNANVGYKEESQYVDRNSIFNMHLILCKIEGSQCTDIIGEPIIDEDKIPVKLLCEKETNL